MTFTVKTISTWGSPNDYNAPAILEARDTYLRPQVDAGNVSGDPIIISNTQVELHWVSREAAEEWKSIIEDVAAKNNLSLTVEITDL